MIALEQIDSVTDFLRNRKSRIDQLKETRAPEVPQRKRQFIRKGGGV